MLANYASPVSKKNCDISNVISNWTHRSLRKYVPGFPVIYNILTSTYYVTQAQTQFSALQAQIRQFAAVVHEAEDGVFAAFCQRIGVENIREYEERQMKVAQEESQARLRFDTQIARLTHQYVAMHKYLVSLKSHHFCFH
jgi:hypothetical protein